MNTGTYMDMIYRENIVIYLKYSQFMKSPYSNPDV
jgi:hypothetical protein